MARCKGSNWLRGRRGSVLLVVTFFLPVLLAFAVATVDVGHMQSQRSRLQAVADMALISAVGNVTWDGATVAEEEVEIRARINQVLRANGLPDDYFGTPTCVAGDDDDVVSVSLDRQVPVDTFFWSFVQPGTSSVEVQVRSAVGVEYGRGAASSRTNVSGFGYFGRSGVNIRGASSIKAYRSTTGASPIPPFTGNGANAHPNTTLWNATKVGTLGDIDAGGGNPNKTIGGELYANGTVTTGNKPIINDDGDTIIKEGSDGDWETFGEDSVPLPDTPADDWVNPPVYDTAGNPYTIDTDGTIRPTNTNGDIIVTAGATYVVEEFNGSQGSLRVTGTSTEPATIYVTGDIHFAGKVSVNGNVRIIGVGPGNIHFSGQSHIYADIYAPERDFRLTGNNQFFGRVVANEIVHTGNGDFYYDMNLGDFNIPRIQNPPPFVAVPVHLVSN